MTPNDQISDMSADEDRRRFLATCGKFAAVTPPAITMLLSTSLNSTAIARSGAKGNNGFGNGGGDGSPNERATPTADAIFAARAVVRALPTSSPRLQPRAFGD